MELKPELRNIYGKLGGDDLFIVNELNRARGFRKLHLETAVIGSSLEILHSVFFPEPTFDLPIFGVDIVVVPEGVSAAIVDLSPVRSNLPDIIEYQLNQIEFPDFKIVRKLPDWGDIFSSHVLFIRPINSQETDLFLDVVDQFLTIVTSYSALINPQAINSKSTIERYEAQMYYCKQQKRNDKTRNVLAKTFSPNWANQYIEMVLFDIPTGFSKEEN